MNLGEQCAHCGLTATETAYALDGQLAIDPCLGRLPGVSFACCGHNEREGYVLFDNSRSVHFLTLTVSARLDGEDELVFDEMRQVDGLLDMMLE